MNKPYFNRLVGYRIRELREMYGYTRDVLSEKAGLSNRYLDDIEAGGKSMTTPKLASLVKACLLYTSRLPCWRF